MNKYLKYILFFTSLSFTHSALALNVYPPEARSLKSTEFGQLVKSYMPNTNSRSPWNFQTNSNNIYWDSSPEWNNYVKKYQKSGYSRINFKGFTLKASPYKTQTLSEAAWGIMYSGNNTRNVDSIYISHATTAGMNSIKDNQRLTPFDSLINQNITYKPICFSKMIGANYSIAYELSAPNKRSLYLVQGVAEGSGGMSTFYELYLNKKDIENDFNKLDDTETSVCL